MSQTRMRSALPGMLLLRHALITCDTPRRCPYSIHLVEFKTLYIHKLSLLILLGQFMKLESNNKADLKIPVCRIKASHPRGPGPDVAL